MVWEIGVFWTGAKEVEDDNCVEGKHGDGQVPTVQQWGETTEQKDTGDGEVLIIFKEMDLIYAIYRTFLNDVTVAFISHINIVSGSIKYEGEKSPNTCRFIYILNN